MSKNDELPLDLPEPPTKEPADYILSSNYTLPSLLARGLMFTPNAGDGEGLAYLDQWHDRFPCDTNGVPEAWSSGVETSARNAFPILLKLRHQRRPIALRSRRDHRSLEALLLEDVDKFVFRSEEEKERFLSFEFENVPLESVTGRAVVDLARFRALAPKGSRTRRADTSDDHELSAIIRRADGIGAIIALILSNSRSNGEWVHQLGLITTVDPKRSMSDCWLREVIERLRKPNSPLPSDLDRALLAATCRVLLRHPLASGWPSAQILSEVVTEALTGSNPTAIASYHVELDAWANHCHEVLSGKTLTVMLSDEKSIARRALLLLLLRGTVQAVSAASLDDPRSGLVVGRNVKMLALALAAAREGLRALGREFKSIENDAQPIDLRKSLSSIIVEEMRCMLTGASRPPSYQIDVGYVRLGSLCGQWEVRLPGTTTICLPAGFHKRLQEAYQRFNKLGIDEWQQPEWSFDAVAFCATGSDGKTRKAILRIPRGDQFKSICQLWLPLDIRIANRADKRGSRIGHKHRDTVLTHILESQAQTAAAFRYVLSDDGESLAMLVELRSDSLTDAEIRRALVDACAEANKMAERIASQS